ncbi:MAG TPA: PfkB family carbohydrate kinase, partial [Solirubrobacteraceae bacterium]
DGGAWHGAVSARGRYPVGSGDALLAGLLTALAAGEPWLRAAAIGLGAAAANAELPGAGRLDPQRARELAAAARIVALAGG